EKRVPGVAGVFRLLHYVEVPVLRKLPHASVSCGKKVGGEPSTVRTNAVALHSRRPGFLRTGRASWTVYQASCSFLVTEISADAEDGVFFCPRPGVERS